jgi:hypothetical protein
MRRTALLLVSLVVLSGIAGVAAGDTLDNPRFETYTPEPTLTPGTTSQLTVQLVNDATDPDDRAPTAQNANATLIANESAIEVQSGTKTVGTLQDGVVTPVTFAVSVPGDIESGTHRLYVDVGYEHDGEHNEVPVEVTVRVDERPRFIVESVESAAPVGGSGPVNVTLRNAGDANVTDGRVTLESRNADLTFGASPTASRHVGSWTAGETRTVQVEATVAPDASRVAHAVTGTVSYEDDGTPGQSRALALGVTPAPEQTFTVGGVDSSLQVDATRSVSVTVTNDGPRTVSDAVLVLQEGATLRPVEGAQPLGELAPGESVEVAVPVRVDGAADPGDRQLDFVVRYSDGGDRRASDTLHATAGVAAEQSFALSNATSTLIVGDEGTVSATVTNDGPERVENAVVQLTTQAATVQPTETEAAVGALDPGESTTFSLPVTIAASGDDGPRQLDFAVQYENADGERRASDTLAVRVPVEAEQEFTVEGTESTLLVGDRGTVTLTVTNDGPETANDAVVQLTTANPNVQPRETEAAVGALAPGESAQVTFPVGIADTAEAGARQLSFAVQYENDAGELRRTDGLRPTVEVAGEQAFSVGGVEGDLRVGEEGELVATVTNDGPLPAGEAVVRLAGVTDNAHPMATEFAAGTLSVGDSATATFPIEISESAESGPRQFSLLVEYRNREGDVLTSDRLSTRVEVAPERPQFGVEADGASLTAGGSDSVTLVVTNNGDEAVTNVNAKAFVDNPLSTTDDEAFVDRIPPGESAKVVFGLDVAGGALQKAYPLSVDFQYDDGSGDTKLTDTYQVAVDVSAPEDDGPSTAVIAGGVLVVVLVVAGALWWRRQ